MLNADQQFRTQVEEKLGIDMEDILHMRKRRMVGSMTSQVIAQVTLRKPRATEWERRWR